jgi:hypothetical protein
LICLVFGGLVGLWLLQSACSCTFFFHSQHITPVHAAGYLGCIASLIGHHYLEHHYLDLGRHLASYL